VPPGSPAVTTLRPEPAQTQPRVRFPSCFLADGFSCVPTVKNPQGGEVVRTLVSCGMNEERCRVSWVEYYYEMVLGAVGRREERLKVGSPRRGLLSGGLGWAGGGVWAAGWVL